VKFYLKLALMGWSLLLGLALSVFAAIDLIRFARTHDSYFGISAIICCLLSNSAYGILRRDGLGGSTSE
jgi:uncharacterized membrane protein